MAVVSISSPHAHDHSSVNRIMLHVCFALLPCTLFSFYLFSWPAVNLFVLTVASALGWESLCLKLMGKPQLILKDYSALLTGWLLALTLPPWAPWWIGVGGSFIAIVIAKQLYGGLGQNLFNPAMVARVALLISFPLAMTTWTLPEAQIHELGFLDSIGITFGYLPTPDGLTGATHLGALKTGLTIGVSANQYTLENFSVARAFFGNTAGSMGETSALLILLGGTWLLLMRIISWHIPVSLLASAAVLATIFHGFDPERYASASFYLLSGGMVLTAFFIATDLVTSPSSKGGQLIFGAGCGALIFVIRTWCGFPEGAGFAVLFMNALTPLIDIYFRPRIYGRRSNRTPLVYENVNTKTVAKVNS